MSKPITNQPGNVSVYSFCKAVGNLVRVLCPRGKEIHSDRDATLITELDPFITQHIITIQKAIQDDQVKMAECKNRIELNKRQLVAFKSLLHSPIETQKAHDLVKAKILPMVDADNRKAQAKNAEFSRKEKEQKSEEFQRDMRAFLKQNGFEIHRRNEDVPMGSGDSEIRFRRAATNQGSELIDSVAELFRAGLYPNGKGHAKSPKYRNDPSQLIDSIMNDLRVAADERAYVLKNLPEDVMNELNSSPANRRPGER